jgi:3-phenylpropionate/trans-cinnamate dioxygenase ferredoxin reductase subunit
MAGSSVVVIGAGQAGCQVAVSLREKGHEGPITVVGDEGVLPYARPPLSKAYLQGKVDLDGLVVRTGAFYRERSVSLRLDDPAVSVDRARRVVRLRSGRQLGYTHLVFATGAQPRTLPGTEVLRTVADASALRARLDMPSRIVVLGAGFIGLELAAVVRERGHEVTVVEALPRALSRAVSATTASWIVAQHEERGVRVRCGTTVSSVDASVVTLADGTQLPADLVVAGVGVRPNVALAQACGLAVDDGIVVDAHLRTTDPAIYAVGDCARFSSVVTGGRLRLESVQNAMDQASCAAAAILGSAEPYAEVPWFWSDQYSIKLQIAGLAHGADREVVVGDVAGGRFSVFCFAGQRLLAVESLNRPVDFVMARRLLSSGEQLTPSEVEAPGFDLRTFVQQQAA